MTAELDTRAPADPDPVGVPGPAVRWPVFITSFVGVCVITLWALVAPANAEKVIGEVVAKVGTGFGWFYVALATAIVVFVVFLGVSRFGSIRLGPDHSRPEFSTFAWASMLFAAGIGTDVMFYSVIEPVSHYTAPPVGEPGTVDAAREATVWTLFHYGVTGWAMYALMGMAFGYFAYRWNMPLSIRSALYPLIGKRVQGRTGDVVDIAALLGTIFGVATSLGIGVVQLNYGLYLLFGIEEGTAAQIGLIVVAVVMATASCVSGVDKGIRRLSELNVLMAVALIVWVLVAGRTSFLLDATVQNLGDYVSSLPGMTMETFAYTGAAEWMAGWTLFFWAWWIAWASFVGLFLARISRGRTIRQFVGGVILVPSTVSLIWFAIFGGSAMKMQEEGQLGKEATPEGQLFGVLQQFPVATATSLLVMVLVGIFFVSGADAASIVMGTLSQKGALEPGRFVVVFWGVVTGAVAAIMLLVGSGQGDALTGLQNLTILAAAPFVIVMIFMCIALMRDLRRDPVVVREQMGSEAVEMAVMEGHKKYDGEFEFRVGPGRGPDVEGDPIGKH